MCVCVYTHTHTHTESSLNVFDSTYFIIFCMPGIVQSVFYLHVTMHRNIFLIIKPTRCTNFTNLFWHETLGQFLCSSSGAGPGWNCCSILVLLESCLQTCMTYTNAECTVNKLLMMDRGAVRNCRVSCQNKFVRLVYLVGFLIRNVHSVFFSFLCIIFGS